MRKIALSTIRFYQKAISPMFAPRCRFYPSCSQYAHEAISVHGFARGTQLSIVRIGKCHPFHPGGVDLVPESEQNQSARGTA